MAMAETNEGLVQIKYVDEAMLIPNNTSVVVRRFPGLPRMPIVIQPKPKVEDNLDIAEPKKIVLPAADSCVSTYPDEKELEDLWGPKVPEPAHAMSKEEEDRKIKALVETPALDWKRKETHWFRPGFDKGMGGRTMAERGSDRTRLEKIRPSQGYVCRRCKLPGHFIHHCPTNGDPNYDIKIVKPPTGIPKSMLMASGDGTYALPRGEVAVLKPNEDAFDKEMEGILSKRSIVDLPPELHCPLCKEAMKDAVLASKCCFRSSCYKCISEHIITKSACICGATNILVDDLVPNKSVRDIINQVLEFGHCLQPKIPMKHKYESVGHSSSPDHHRRQELEPPRLYKRKLEHQHHRDFDQRRRIESSTVEKASLVTGCR